MHTSATSTTYINTTTTMPRRSATFIIHAVISTAEYNGLKRKLTEIYDTRKHKLLHSNTVTFFILFIMPYTLPFPVYSFSIPNLLSSHWEIWLNNHVYSRVSLGRFSHQLVIGNKMTEKLTLKSWGEGFILPKVRGRNRRGTEVRRGMSSTFDTAIYK